ncbi:hypothetical protein HPB52_024074 [Rhipicephalus sanguineus]|uniref:Tick transposon n=1 Tax=Rhipicephalus sanguineus TaxID=34632 RepID=A0A9D4PNN9_RHISA|nr:hypothetical protein HPB52_024074 [Rhipicephalus sanguineus]
MSFCIDYCFLSPVLLPKLSYMSIDSTGERSLGSDHHSIFLSFGTNPPETKRDAHAGNLRPLSDEALERVVDQLEEDAPRMEGQGYEELQQWIRRTIQDEAGAGRVTRGRHRRKAWWDGEVAEALAQRKQCCRRHRHALGRGADEAELSALWSLYLEAKKEMASMVQRKMSTVNRKLLRAIKEAGRDSSRKFWQHIKAQQTNSDLPSHQLRDPESGREDELASAPPRCDSITQRELDRAIGRLAGSSAAGPDGIPPGLLKRTKRQTREVLLEALNGRRLSGLPDGRWAREVYKYVHLRSVRTKWVARTRSLSERYRVEAIRLTAPLQRDTRKKVRESVSAVETERWRESGRAKRALALYWEAKTDIAKEALYDNSRGSGLLCEARSGVLRTRSLRARYTAELDTMCPLCQGAEETIRHIVLECTGLRLAIHDAQNSGTSAQGATGATNDNSDLARALGFRGSGETPSWEAVEATKRRLECWWRKQVEQTRAPRR